MGIERETQPGYWKRERLGIEVGEKERVREREKLGNGTDARINNLGQRGICIGKCEALTKK